MLKPETLAKMQQSSVFLHGEGFAGRLEISQVWGEGMFVAHGAPRFEPGAVISLRLPPEVQSPPLCLTCEVLQVVAEPPAAAGYALKILEAKGERRPSIEAMKARTRRSTDAAVAGPRVVELKAPPKRKRRGAGPDVLVVEDDRVSAKLIAEWLRASGHRPVVAGTGAAAIEAVDANADSLVVAIVDSLLPDMVGKELIPKLKAKLPALTVLAVSGVFTADSAQRAVRRAGADEFLQKPLARDAFTSTISAAFDAKRKAS